jgi:hypothetical protein
MGKGQSRPGSPRSPSSEAPTTDPTGPPRLLHTCVPHESDAVANLIAYMPGGLSTAAPRLLASFGTANEVGVWDAGTGLQVASLCGKPQHVRSLAIFDLPPHNRPCIAAGDEEGNVWCWDGDSFEPRWRAPGAHGGRVLQLHVYHLEGEPKLPRLVSAVSLIVGTLVVVVVSLILCGP